MTLAELYWNEGKQEGKQEATENNAIAFLDLADDETIAIYL